MMPPGGAAPRADMADTLQRMLHARETDPELGRLLDALEPWAAGRGPGVRRRPPDPLGAARLREVGPRARRPRGRDHAREGGRAAGLAGGARRPPTSPASATRSTRHVELRHALRRLLRGPRASLRRAARRLRARPDDGRAAAAVRASCARRWCRSSPPPATREQPRNDGVFAGHSSVESQRAAVLELLDADRLRPRPLAAGPVAAPVRPEPRHRPTSGSRRSTTSTTSASRSTRCCTSSATGSTRRRSIPAWRARRSPSPSRSACTSPRAGCGRTSSAARARSAPGCCRSCARHFPGSFDGIDADRRSTARSTPSSRR